MDSANQTGNISEPHEPHKNNSKQQKRFFYFPESPNKSLSRRNLFLAVKFISRFIYFSNDNNFLALVTTVQNSRKRPIDKQRA